MLGEIVVVNDDRAGDSSIARHADDPLA